MQCGVGRYGTGAEASGRGAVAGVNGAMSTSTAASIASGIKPGGSMGGGIGGLVGGSSMGWSSLGSSAAPGGKEDHGASAFFYLRAHQHQQQPLPHQPLPHPMYLPEHSAMLPRDGIAMHASRERVAAAQISSHLPMHSQAPVLPGSAVNAMDFGYRREHQTSIWHHDNTFRGSDGFDSWGLVPEVCGPVRLGAFMAERYYGLPDYGGGSWQRHASVFIRRSGNI